MAFSKVKVAGWSFGEILTSSQMNTLDTDHANAIDGVAGGTYDLTGNMVIDSSTAKTWTFDLACLFDNDVVFSTGATNIHGAALDVTCASTFSNTAAFNGDVALGNATADSVALKAIMTPTSSGRIRETAKVVTSALSTVNVDQFQNIIFGGGIGATTTTTLASAAAGDGDWFILCNGSGFTQNVNGLVSFALPDLQGRKYVRISGTWTEVNVWTA